MKRRVAEGSWVNTLRNCFWRMLAFSLSVNFKEMSVFGIARRVYCRVLWFHFGPITCFQKRIIFGSLANSFFDFRFLLDQITNGFFLTEFHLFSFLKGVLLLPFGTCSFLRFIKISLNSFQLSQIGLFSLW